MIFAVLLLVIVPAVAIAAVVLLIRAVARHDDNKDETYIAGAVPFLDD